MSNIQFKHWISVSQTFMSPDQLIHQNSQLEGLWGKSLPKHIMLCFIFLIKTVIKTNVSLKLCCRNRSLEIQVGRKHFSAFLWPLVLPIVLLILEIECFLKSLKWSRFMLTKEKVKF